MARYDVAVIGLGRFGSALALRLVEEGREVLGMTHVAASLMTATALNELGVREIWAKAGSRQHVEALTRLGVSRIIQPEHEAGLAMASEILHR